MISLAEYISDLRLRLKRSHVADACEKIINYLVDTPNERLQLLTFSSLARALDRPCEESELLTIVTILKNNHPPALSIHYLYIDDDQEYEVDPVRAQEYIRTNTMVDRSGTQVDNAREKLFPFFSVSDSLKTMKLSGDTKDHDYD